MSRSGKTRAKPGKTQNPKQAFTSILTSWVSFMNESGDHFASGVKICLPISAVMVDNMFTAFTTQAAVSATT